MKKNYFLLTLLIVGFFVSANAQRERHGDSGGGGRGGYSHEQHSGGGSNQSYGSRQNNSRSFDRPANQPSYNRQPSQSVGGRSQNTTVSNDRNSRWQAPQANGNSSWSNNTSRQPVNRNVTVNNNVTRVNNINNGYRNRYPGGGYSSTHYTVYNNYAPRRYVYLGALRYSTLPHGFINIHFGGYPYYYHSGLFYSNYDGFYQPVYAPIGIHVSILPFGYFPLYIGSRRYYYYDGIYYSNYATNDYQVVDAPLGAQVSALPKGATVATVNGEKFYEFNGTYYKEGVNSKNEVVYTVAGKYGEVNNTNDQPATSLQPGLHIGDIIPVLPDGCKEVTIEGKQLYVSPNNTYYKAVVNGTDTNYQIVGVPETN